MALCQNASAWRPAYLTAGCPLDVAVGPRTAFQQKCEFPPAQRLADLCVASRSVPALRSRAFLLSPACRGGQPVSHPDFHEHRNQTPARPRRRLQRAHRQRPPPRPAPGPPPRPRLQCRLAPVSCSSGTRGNWAEQGRRDLQRLRQSGGPRGWSIPASDHSNGNLTPNAPIAPERHGQPRRYLRWRIPPPILPSLRRPTRLPSVSLGNDAVVLRKSGANGPVLDVIGKWATTPTTSGALIPSAPRTTSFEKAQRSHRRHQS
jgi:hypothetical protein